MKPSLWPWPSRQKTSLSILAHDDASLCQVWLLFFFFFKFSNSEDIVQTNIRQHFEVSLWPWHWTQQSKFFTWHSSTWDCTIKPCLIVKESAVQKKQWKQSYSDYKSPCCDLDLENSEPIFLHDTLTHDNTPPYQVWLERLNSSRRYHPDKHLLTLRTFKLNLTSNTVIQFFTGQKRSYFDM